MSRRLRDAEFLIERVQRSRRDLVDQAKQIVAAAVDGVRPDGVSAARIGKLHVHAHKIAGGEKVALHDAVDPQLLPGRFRVDGLLVAELEH